MMSLFAISWSIVVSPVRAIENDPGKTYMLTEKHGPWMVMVATFRDIEAEDRKKDGMKAEVAASTLVHELRSKGIPAYVYSQQAKKGNIESFDRLGNKDKRVFAAQREMICVLAGNYPKVDDQVAQKTLAYIKRYQPKFMADKKSGAVVRNENGPLSGAFLSINPLLKPEEIVNRKADNETRYLNSGIDFPLVGVRHKYTLKVATFTGKSVVPLGNSKFNGHEGSFEKAIAEAGPYNLTRAGEDATQLTYALRQNSASNRKTLGRDKFEAYVYHDKFQSMVTVGGFDSENDPQIRQLAEIFRAKYKADEQGEYELIGEALSLPNQNPKLPPVHTWAFDPVPELIEVPRIK